MIIVDGSSSVVKGTEKEVLADLTFAIKHVREELEKCNDKQTVHELIAFAGMLAFMSDDELAVVDKEKKQVIKDFLERVHGK